MKYIEFILVFLIICLLFIILYPVVSSADEVYMPPESPKLSVIERIAICESGDNPHAKNPYSSASGRFQFLWSSWYRYGLELWGQSFYEKNIFSYQDNTELAEYVISKYGTGPWYSSKSCWNT